MKLYRDEAIVLRTHKLGEADRIVTLLTRAHGKVRGVAKGVRRTRSKFGARLEPFMLIDVQLYTGRNLDTVTQVETIGAYAGGIICDYDCYTAASAMVETADRLTPVEHEPAAQHFLLLAGMLRSLASKEHNPQLLMSSYLLRSMAIAGYAPSFSDCAKCGEPGPHRFLAIAAGGSVCTACKPQGSLAPSPVTIELLGSLLSAQWELPDRVEQRYAREAAGIASAYTQWHLEHRVRSLRLVGRS